MSDKPVKAPKAPKAGGITKKYDSSANKSSYSSKSLPYDKKNISHNTQSQVTKFRKGYKEISPDAQMIVDQIIDPAMQNSTVLLPTYGVGSVYTATNILAAKYDQNGESIVATYPSLKESIYYTSGSNVVTTLTGSSGAHVPYMKQRCSIRRGATLLPFVQPFNVEGNRAVLAKPSTAAGTFLYAFRPAVSPNNDINVRAVLADNHNAGNLTFTLSKWDSNEVLLGTVTAPFTSGASTITMFVLHLVSNGYLLVFLQLLPLFLLTLMSLSRFILVELTVLLISLMFTLAVLSRTLMALILLLVLPNHTL